MIENIDVQDEMILKALRRMPLEARRELVRALGTYAEVVVRRSRSRASSKLLKLAIRSLSEQNTAEGATITAGGGTRVPKGNGTYGDVFFGAEFGGGSRAATRQFQPYRSKGYAFWPAVWDMKQLDRISTILDKIAREWSR